MTTSELVVQTTQTNQSNLIELELVILNGEYGEYLPELTLPYEFVDLDWSTIESVETPFVTMVVQHAVIDRDTWTNIWVSYGARSDGRQYVQPQPYHFKIYEADVSYFNTPVIQQIVPSSLV